MRVAADRHGAAGGTEMPNGDYATVPQPIPPPPPPAPPQSSSTSAANGSAEQRAMSAADGTAAAQQQPLSPPPPPASHMQPPPGVVRKPVKNMQQHLVCRSGGTGSLEDDFNPRLLI